MTLGSTFVVVDGIERSTRIGEVVADVACIDASTALAIASAGRHVWTFATTAEAAAQIESANPEVRSRITISAHPFVSAAAPLFDAVYHQGGFQFESEPLKRLYELQSGSRADAPVFLIVPNGIVSGDADQWLFHPETISDLFLPLADTVCTLPPDRQTICIETRRHRVTPTRRMPPRIAVLLHLKSEDRFVNQCLASLSGLATYIIGIDANAPEHSVTLIRKDERVLRAARLAAIERGSEAALARAQQQASQWLPEWVLEIDASEILAPDAFDRILSATRSSPQDVSSLSLETIMLWDQETQRRLDTPPDYQRRVRVRRAHGNAGSHRHLDAQILDFSWFNAETRSARRAVDIATPRRLNASAFEPWILKDPQLGPFIANAAEESSRALMAEAITSRVAGCERALCLDTAGFDVGHLLKERWPATTLTLVSQRRSHPNFTPYNFALTGPFEALDVPHAFGSTTFDVVIDGDAFVESVALPKRLRNIRRALHDGGTAFLRFDDSYGELPFTSVLENRLFLDAGLIIKDIRTTHGQLGQRISVVSAIPYREPIDSEFKLTLVLPRLSNEHNLLAEDLLYDARNDARIAVIVADVDLFAGRSGAAYTAGPSVKVFEGGTDSIAAVVYAHASSDALCILPRRAMLASGWAESIASRLADPAVGCIKLDDTTLVVKRDALHPFSWPRNYSDDALGAAVIHSLITCRGFATIEMGNVLINRDPPAVASGERLRWERARALRAGVSIEQI